MNERRIFLSYRPDDAPGHAGRIHDRLRGRFGDDAVFADVLDLRPGGDVDEEIERVLSSCDVLIVVIGTRWVAPPRDVAPASFEPAHAAIRSALDAGVAIVPVLVDGAAMPSPGDLPPGIAALARRPAIAVSDARFDADVARLLDLVQELIGVAGTARRAAGDPAQDLEPAARDRAGIEVAYGERAGVASADVRRESRKTVTALFCDLVASTALGEAMDPEALSHILDRYFAEMHRVIAMHGGLTEWYAGDSVVAVFGLPTLHEDDALRAVRASWDMRDALAEVNAWIGDRWAVTLRARTGVNTGEVLVGPTTDRKRLVIGDAINTAARLEQAAEPGDILIGSVTHQLVRGSFETEAVEPLTLKGKSLPVPAWRLVGRRGSAGGDRPDGPMVGRVEELGLLHRAYGRAVSDRSCFLFTLIGSAGVGKTRLVTAFGEEVSGEMGGEARVLHGSCLPYGEAITYLPFAEAIRQAAGLDGKEPAEEARLRVNGAVEGAREAERLVEALVQVAGFETVSSAPEELWWAVRGFLEHLARERPLVLIVEDIHWAEPSLLDLLEHLADWAREAPFLLICSARHELVESRPGWAGGKLNATTVTLEPLQGADAEEVMRNVLGGGELSEDLRRWIARAAEGNPLFIEELVRMLTEEGRLHREDAGWVASGDLSQVAVPPTISALIAARVDALAQDARELLERASVIGREFRMAALEELSPPDLRPRMRAELMTLIRKELIRPVASAGPDEQFRFRHNLVRDAAYAAMPKEVRGFLHEQYADWLERAAGDGPGEVGELEEIVGFHLEQAFVNLNAVRPGTARERRLSARAAERLASAGSRASARGDVRRALGMLSRAVDIEPEDAPDRLDTLVNLAQVLWESGDFARASAMVTDVIEAARAAGNERIEAHARLLSLWGELFAAPDVDLADVRSEAERLVEVFRGLGDELGLARGSTILGEVHLAAGRADAAAADAINAVDHARRAEQGWLVSVNLSLHVAAVTTGPTPVDAAIARCREVLAQVAGNPVSEAWIGRNLARLLAMRGEFDQARELIRRGKEVMDQFGYGFILAGGLSLSSGYIEELSGDDAAAEAELRWGYRILEQMGERSMLSSVAARLARVVLAQGSARLDEAAGFARTSDRAVGRLLGSQIAAREVEALVMAAEGRLQEAVSMAREAVAIADRTDFLVDRAEAHATLARMLASTGAGAPGAPDVATSEAAAELDVARALLVRKGNVVAAAALERSAAAPADGSSVRTSG